jgi:hypothetical protein
MTEKDNYRLYYKIVTSLFDGDAKVREVECQGATAEMHALDEWMANNEAKVREGAAAIGDVCADEVMSMLDMKAGSANSTEAAVAQTGR